MYNINNEEVKQLAKLIVSNIKYEKKIIVAKDLMKDKDLTQIDAESEFKRAINTYIGQYRPTKILETGTYLGEGSTRIIIESLLQHHIDGFEFYTIEINPNYYITAEFNLAKRGLSNYVNLLNGLSVPKHLLPTYEQIQEYTVNNIEFNNIIIDHSESERALNYFRETNFNNLEDNLIDKVLMKFNYSPDFVLLDSAGHIGNIEFNYLISKVKSRCIIALDDANHLKHHKSYLQMIDDKRFNILIKSDEKFGFVIAEFNPFNSISNINTNTTFDFNNKDILIVRTDSIGDTILSIGMLKSIKEQFPYSKITVLIQQHLSEIYKLCPYINNTIEIVKDLFFRDEKYRIDLINTFLQYKFDYSINTIYSRDLLSDMFATAKNINYKIALNGDLSNNDEKTKSNYDGKYNLLVNSIKGNALEFNRHRDLLNAIGIHNYDALPWIWFDDKTIDFAENFYKSYQLDREKVIILFAGGQHSIRDYKYFDKGLNNVENIENFTVIAIGGEREYELHQEIFKGAKFKYLNLCGKLSLIESACLVYYSKLSIGTETSFSHIACAVEKPNITILGGGHFGRFLPYHQLSSIIYLPLDCYFCNWNCKFDKPYCIENIDPQLITKAVNDILNGKTGIIYKQLYNNEAKTTLDSKISLKEISNLNLVEVEVNNIIDTTPKVNIDNNIKVSAIVSIYKSERFMKGLMEDLVNQTLFQSGKLEIIMINSNSPENEFAIIEPYLNKFPNQIIYHKTKERETLYKAWNRGIELSKGKYITSANTDDRHRIDALELLSKCLDENPEYDLVYPDLIITEIENKTFSNTQSLLRYEFPDYNLGTVLSNSNFGAQPMWKKSVHNTIGYFDESYKIGGDYEFFIRLSKEFKPIHLRETLGLFLQGKDALSNKKNISDMMSEVDRTIKLHRRNIDLFKIYPMFSSNNKNLIDILAVLWDFGLLNMLSPYNDFELSIMYFNKCYELSKDTPYFNIVKDMYNNNMGIINIVSDQIKLGLNLWNKSKNDLKVIHNLKLFQSSTSKLYPIRYQASILDHPILVDARSAIGLYLDENMQIKRSDKITQFFWDVYFGNGGLEMTQNELINAQQLKPRSPKSFGYLKSYRFFAEYKHNNPPIKNLTSLSNAFWNRDYINKKNVLIKTPNAIGDSLAITVIVNNLKQYYPHLNIIVACGKNEAVIYENNPHINSIIKNNSYDTDILELNKDSLEIIDYNNILSKLPEYYNGISFLDIFANIAGFKLIDREYKYYIQNDEINKVKNLIKDSKMIFAIHLNTSKDIKRSYPHSNELVIELLNEYPDCLIINLGQLKLDIRDERVIDAAKLNLTLREQVALSSFATDFITIDSSFFHFAHNLFKKPTFAIFGPTNPDLVGNPFNTFYVIENRNLDCLHCYWTRDNDMKCMNELSPKEIIKQMKEKYKIGKYYSGTKVINYENEDYEEFIYNLYTTAKDGKKIIINDVSNKLPYFSNNWNGIELKRN